MKLEDQITSTDLAKRLKELGVPQTAFWSWFCDEECDDTPVLNRTDEHVVGGVGYYDSKYSAFTVAELGELLPKCYITLHRLNGQWECYQDFVKVVEGHDPMLIESYEENHVSTFSHTEADARAMMLIFLREPSPCL